MLFRPFRYGFLISMRLFRVVLTTSNEWGAVVTKLNVPADWKGLSLSVSVCVLFSFVIKHHSSKPLCEMCRMADLRAALGTVSGFRRCVLHIHAELRLVLELPSWERSTRSTKVENFIPWFPVFWGSKHLESVWSSRYVKISMILVILLENSLRNKSLVSKYEWNPPNTHVLSLLFCFLLLWGKSCMSLNCLYYVFFGPNFFQTVYLIIKDPFFYFLFF